MLAQTASRWQWQPMFDMKTELVSCDDWLSGTMPGEFEPQSAIVVPRVNSKTVPMRMRDIWTPQLSHPFSHKRRNVQPDGRHPVDRRAPTRR